MMQIIIFELFLYLTPFDPDEVVFLLYKFGSQLSDGCFAHQGMQKVFVMVTDFPRNLINLQTSAFI